VCHSLEEFTFYALTDIDCGNFSTLNNGIYTLSDPSDTTYGAIAYVKCDAGHIASKDVITCTINGTWTHATCTAVGKSTVNDIHFQITC